MTTKRADGAGDGFYPLAQPEEGLAQLLPEIILSEKPYPIAALIVNHANPARSLPNTTKVEKALAKLELLVVIDVQMSETAQMAHYILPESTYLERLDPLIVSTRLVSEVALRQPVVKPLYDTKPATEIITGLAQTLGLSRFLGFAVEETIQAQLKTIGLTLESLKKSGVWQGKTELTQGPPRFTIPSGKVELYSEALMAKGFEPLPVYEPPRTMPDIHAFRLLTGHEAMHTGTATQGNPYMAALSKENTLWIHPARAARLGIENGNLVIVTSPTGQVRVRARLTEGIHPEAVFLAHGYGRDSKLRPFAFGQGGNDSALIADQAEPLVGGAALGETIVTVRRG
ncbi:MAG: molybdopterin-dependent oxidoreductase [Chloroflexi bacterium]|nr:molybdopterin-dependent oxidoreductase [Chloroflexota bacterium]